LQLSHPTLQLLSEKEEKNERKFTLSVWSFKKKMEKWYIMAPRIGSKCFYRRAMTIVGLKFHSRSVVDIQLIIKQCEHHKIAENRIHLDEQTFQTFARLSFPAEATKMAPELSTSSFGK
jgi:hypothetical protein